MLKDSRWLFVPAAIVLGSLYGVLHALPPSTEPPRAQAATGAAAAFGLLSLFSIHSTSKKANTVKVLLALLLLAVLVYSVYRIQDHVQQAGCSSDKEEVSYVMAGGGDFHTFWVYLCLSVAVGLIYICFMTCMMGKMPGNDEDEDEVLKWMLVAWLTTVIIGLACASGGQYRCHILRQDHHVTRLQ